MRHLLLICSLSAATLAGFAGEAPEAPPSAPRAEAPGQAPGPDWVWEGGHWEQRNGQQEWVAGRYLQLPPKPAPPAPPPPPPTGAVWLPGQWRWAENEWHWTPGHYEVSASPPPAPATVTAPPPERQEIIVQSAPPPVRVEVIPERPEVETVWVPGYWTWQFSAWVWIGGCWSRPPHPHAVWVEPRWDHDPAHGWRYAPGRWHGR